MTAQPNGFRATPRGGVAGDRLYWNPEIVTEMMYEVLQTSLRVPDGSYGPY